MRHAVFIGVDRRASRIRRRVTAGGSPTRPSPTSSSPRVTSDAFSTRGCAARCSIGCRLRPPTVTNASATARRDSHRASGCAGPGPRRRCGTACRRCAAPLLALAGSDDIRFAAHALRVARLAPQAVASLVPGGGHAVHLSQPDQTWRIVQSLARVGASPPSYEQADRQERAGRRVWSRAVAPSMGRSARPLRSPSASRTG